MRTALLLGFIFVSPAALAQGGSPEKSIPEAVKQLEPEVISAESKAFLKMKMKNHIKDMKNLSVAVATVKMHEVQRLAQDIANQPRLDPAVGPSAKLPPRFFELQDSLKKTAQALADAGKADQLGASLEHYQQLVAHCVACHAAFKPAVATK